MERYGTEPLTEVSRVGLVRAIARFQYNSGGVAPDYASLNEHDYAVFEKSMDGLARNADSTGWTILGVPIGCDDFDNRERGVITMWRRNNNAKLS